MIETVISSSVLIFIIIIVRTVFKGRIKSTVRYALWLIAAVRLMLPVNLSESAVSVMNLASRLIPETRSVEEIEENPEIYSDEQPYIPEKPPSPEASGQNDVQTVHYPYSDDGAKPSAAAKEYPLSSRLNAFRIAVTAIMLIWFAAVNLMYSRTLRRTRKEFRHDAPLRIYTLRELSSPFLFGLFPPVIYIPEGSSQDSEAVEYIVTHEMCHYYHGDMFWTVLRYVLLSVYWFDPFVWAAAILSKRDCECACDEAAIGRLGEDRRLGYGKAIIDLIPRKSEDSFGVASTSMASGKEVIKERMRFIVSKPRNKAYALIFTVTIVFLTIGCTFTSAQTREDTTSAVVDTENVPVSAQSADRRISISVTDLSGTQRQLIFFPAPDGYEPYIYMDEYVPAEISAPYFGERAEGFAVDSRFSSADIVLDGRNMGISKSENTASFNALIHSLAGIYPEYSGSNESGEPCAQLTFSRSNGGFSSALCIDFYRNGERVSAKITADDFSGLTALLFGDIPTEAELESAYKGSVHFESELFYADSLYEMLCSISDENNRDTEETPSYESFRTDMFSESIAKKLNVTGEIPKGYIRCEYGNIAFGVPKEGSVNEIGSLFLWQNGDADLRISAAGSHIPDNSAVISGEFGGQPCYYYENNNSAEIIFTDENGGRYYAAVSFKNILEKETAMSILGSIHTVYRTKPEYMAPDALNA